MRDRHRRDLSDHGERTSRKLAAQRIPPSCFSRLLEARWAEEMNCWSADDERGILLQAVPKVAALSNGSHAIVIRRFFNDSMHCVCARAPACAWKEGVLRGWGQQRA